VCIQIIRVCVEVWHLKNSRYGRPQGRQATIIGKYYNGTHTETIPDRPTHVRGGLRVGYSLTFVYTHILPSSREVY